MEGFINMRMDECIERWIDGMDGWTDHVVVG
jgi:hypothetical protein